LIESLDPYGSTESTREDGAAISSFVYWDSKITTVNAILGGVGSFVKQKMDREGIYDEFNKVLSREYGMVFKNLNGENVNLCLPSVPIPDARPQDYTGC
jgi:hypothetical protein